MAEVSTPAHSAASPSMGMPAPRAGHGIAERLRNAKREAVEEALGKGESWCRKIINGDAGVMLDDIEPLASVLDMKLVAKHKRCVDPDVYDAVMLIHERLAPHVRKLVWDGSE